MLFGSQHLSFRCSSDVCLHFLYVASHMLFILRIEISQPWGIQGDNDRVVVASGSGDLLILRTGTYLFYVVFGVVSIMFFVSLVFSLFTEIYFSLRASLLFVLLC